jgi:hypothetical protein
MIEHSENVVDLKSIEQDCADKTASIQKWLQIFVERIEGQLPDEGVEVHLPEYGIVSGRVVKGDQGLYALLNDSSKAIAAV